MMQSLQQKNVSYAPEKRDISTSVKQINKHRFLPKLMMVICMLFSLIGFSTQASAQLATGDLAFTSFNADEDGWSLVTFVDLPANTIVYFTDNEATSLTAFNTGESYFQWNTGPNIIAAGTVVRFNNVDNATTLGASVGTLTRATVSGNTNYGLSTTADVIYAFLGTSASAPTLILAAISSGDVVTPGDVITNAGLTTGTNAIVIRSSADYGEYNGARSAQPNFANYKSLVFDVANWTVDQNDGTYTTTIPNTTAFTIAAVTPTVNLAVSTNSGSEAGSTAITVTANASAPVSGDQTVQLTVSGTGITAGDYNLTNTVITIPSGGTSGSATFTVADDILFEGDETAVLTINNPSAGITLGATVAQNIVITDNDAAPPSVNLSSYVRIGRYDLPEPTRTTPPANSLLAQEVSAVTYNWDTQTLFVVGDGGTSVVQVSKTGQLINSMTLAPGGSPQGTEFYDPEGLTYIGNGQFVMSEERDRQAVLFTYAAGTTLTRSATKTVKLGTFVQNIGIEGISYDPLTNGYICVKEKTPQGIFQTGIDFDAGTATNGSATTENSINLFDPALTNTLDFADVFALSNLPALNGQSDYGNLLVLSQESGKIINVDRAGNISSSLTIVSDPGNPLDVPGQQHEGLTMDRDGNLYVVSENGGGDFDHPQLWVYAPSLVPNQAPTALTLSNTTNSIQENTSTLNPIKVADIVVTDDGLGANNLTVSGPDAAFFEITGFGLFIKAGTVLDYETKTSYSITINVDDPTVGNTPDATTTLTLNITDVINETTQLPAIIISEVAPWSSGNSPVAADWFEVTNTTNSAIDITGWKMDDNSNSFASSVALSGITSIAPGESVIFIETADLPGKSAAFLSNWFGASLPAGLHIGSYSGSGVGLSTGGDAVNLFNSAGVLQANVTFGASPAGPFPTFNNAAGLNNSAITQLSIAGVNDAFAAVNSTNEIGSPGSIGKLFISEVAPWSSGNSPVAADWFEVTNTRATAVDITGWKMDDNSGSFAASVALNGITSIAPGESVIFLETADLPGKSAAFLSNWFGANPPAGLRIGNYTGSGVGLSTSGDAVNLYSSTGILQSSVIFGASPAAAPFSTFDNAAGLNNTTITQLSAEGTNGAFVASANANEIGSPGAIIDLPCSSAPNQPAAFTAKTTFVYRGDNAVAYTVPTQPGVTYAWTFSGAGAIINGTTNAVTVNYSTSATSGNLSVTANNACGASPARTLAIAVNTSISVNTTNYEYSFVTVGCNRVDYLDTAFTTGDPDYSTGASTANVYQLKRLFTEIAHLNPLPKFLIMTGDIVMGYKTPSTADTLELAKQLTAWKNIYESSPLASLPIQLVTIPGNHETQDKAAGKKSFVQAEQIFTRIMAPYIIGNNGPGIGGPDELATDQSKLTYSFDYNGDHFIVIDTDPVGKDNQTPYKWIGADIQAARANGARHIFAFGHKPAYSSPLTPKGGLDADATIAQRDSLWKYFEDYNCEAMFSAHEHLWDSINPHFGKTWQVIAGNGGSRVEPVWVGQDRQYYGYTLVNIYTDKKVNVMGLGRNTDQSTTAGGTPYPVNEDAYPTTVRNNFNICLTTTSTTNVTACVSYIWNSTEYTSSGTYTFTTHNIAGCDSIATLHLTINQPTTGDTTATACGSFTWYGTEYTESGTAIHVLTNAAGCDSTVTLHLTIGQPTSSTESATACGSFTWNGTEYTSSGTYTFTTTNAAGCDSTATLSLTINPVPLASANAGTITCNAGTAIVTVNATDGTAPYTGTGNFTVVAGNYNYIVSDINGCADTVHINVSEPAAIAYTVQTSAISCFGGTTTATILATGGNAPYTYRINSKKAQTSNVFTNIKAGSYLMTITDASGCSISSSFSITQPTKLKLLITEKIRPSCIGATNGSIVVNAVGGTPAYAYSFNNGTYSANNSFINLSAGDYTIAARDANGCSVGGTVRLADVRVSCTTIAIQQNQPLVSNAKVSKAGLSIKVLPNPSTTNFTLILQSNSNENVQVIVSDMYGKKLYQVKGGVNQQYSFGNNFVNGMYIVQVIQGNNIQTLKLIKGKG